MWNRQTKMMPITMPATVPLIVPNAQLAAAYVPIQYYVSSFPPPVALEKGTMFPELFSPYGKEKEIGGERFDCC
jgi:hypothetical protein